MAWTWQQVFVASGRAPTIILLSVDGKHRYLLTSRVPGVTEAITVIPLAAYWLVQSAKKKRNSPKENVKDQGNYNKEPPTASPTVSNGLVSQESMTATARPTESDREMV